MGQRDNEITAMVSVWVPEEFRKFHSCVFHGLVYKLRRPSGNCSYPLPEFKASAMIRTAYKVKRQLFYETDESNSSTCSLDNHILV